MSNDDSRGHKNPDRPHESTTDYHTSDHHIPDPNGLTDEARLEVIDRLATELLENADGEQYHEFRRHCRELRAEVEAARRVHPETDTRMVCARGPGTASMLGPDPVLLDEENAHSRTVVPDR